MTQRNTLTPQQRMANKLKAKARRDAEKEARQEIKQTLKLATLGFDYSDLDEHTREQVQAAALEIRARLKRTVEDMIFIGQDLNAVKKMLPDRFEEWVKAEFGMSIATASEYRNAAERFSANIQLLYLLSPTIVRRLAAPSVPDEAVALVIATAKKSTKPLRVQDAMAIVKPFLPAKPPRPKQLPPPSMPQLTGPAPNGFPESEPEPDAIDGEYTIMPAELSFAEWLAAMPTDLDLRDHLAILELAKGSATRLRSVRPSLYNAVSNAIPSWSMLIIAVEKELKNE